MRNTTLKTLKKTKTNKPEKQPYNTAILLLGTYPKKLKGRSQRDLYTYRALVTTAKRQK